MAIDQTSINRNATGPGDAGGSGSTVGVPGVDGTGGGVLAAGSPPSHVTLTNASVIADKWPDNCAPSGAVTGCSGTPRGGAAVVNPDHVNVPDAQRLSSDPTMRRGPDSSDPTNTGHAEASNLS